MPPFNDKINSIEDDNKSNNQRTEDQIFNEFIGINSEFTESAID